MNDDLIENDKIVFETEEDFIFLFGENFPRELLDTKHESGIYIVTDVGD